ncbi:hypothetical protein APHMUC_0630 [Anaplasma phagocytophilum str. ApMUC09]|uniref:Uncharacterized protein n=1 Tax=Anaplasma phagocytophilum str. ApMUC09 TaxID=1359152 RepID=A0A0F3N8J1_ANAPH|nr:hypothetical protein APHMUC_0639 [Anaplasma phagocytophilum str. ApMUC09]KJV64766.1 hypothetical protein APHMUC_0630 [Anaplasma phagocytophilum str. ApMUC09]
MRFWQRSCTNIMNIYRQSYRLHNNVVAATPEGRECLSNGLSYRAKTIRTRHHKGIAL